MWILVVIEVSIAVHHSHYNAAIVFHIAIVKGCELSSPNFKTFLIRPFLRKTTTFESMLVGGKKTIKHASNALSH